MKISIITATYNSSYTVRDTLECIQNQTYNNIEHIIVDGLSNDGTIDIIRSYPHVATIISEKDSGIYDAMNKGLALATGDIIGILNSDDIYISNNVLENINSYYNEKEVWMTYGKFYAWDGTTATEAFPQNTIFPDFIHEHKLSIIEHLKKINVQIYDFGEDFCEINFRDDKLSENRF